MTLNLGELFTLANQLVSSEIVGSYIPYIISASVPGVDDRDKAWIQLDSGRRPIAIKVWVASSGGNWRRIYNGMIGEIRGYHGNPANDFDTDGRGLIGDTYDGWQLCNGMHGSPDLSDKFLVGGHMNKSNSHPDYDSGGWVTHQDTGVQMGGEDLHNGGLASKLIDPQYLPPLHVQITGYEYKSDADHPDAIKFIIDSHYGNMNPHTLPIVDYGSNPDGTPQVPQINFPTLPPFVALGWVIFQGY